MLTGTPPYQWLHVHHVLLFISFLMKYKAYILHSEGPYRLISTCVISVSNVLLFFYCPLVTSNRKVVLQGTTLWKFKDERVLQYPLGISVDNYGNAYVVGYDSNNVVVISPNGQRHRQLWTMCPSNSTNILSTSNSTIPVTSCASRFAFHFVLDEV
jgi:hypothetical protein